MAYTSRDVERIYTHHARIVYTCMPTIGLRAECACSIQACRTSNSPRDDNFHFPITHPRYPRETQTIKSFYVEPYQLTVACIMLAAIYGQFNCMLWKIDPLYTLLDLYTPYYIPIRIPMFPHHDLK